MSVIRTEEYTAENDEFSTDALNARPEQATSSSIADGWASAEVTKSSTGDYPEDFKFPEAEGKASVVKFLEESGPFAVYKQHFLKQKTEGKRSYVCIGANCPLCLAFGVKDTPGYSPAEDKRAFNIINLSAAGGPQHQVLTASKSLYNALHTANFSQQGPLTKNYWALSRTGKVQTTRYYTAAIKPRDLMEDWQLDEAAADAVVASTKLYTSSIIKESTLEELQEVVNSLK
jgi:hypothetical protein